MMATSQRSQQEAFQELTRVSKDKSNDSMFMAIKTFDGTNRQIFEDWIDKVDQACRASNRGFRTELFKKSAGAGDINNSGHKKENKQNSGIGKFIGLTSKDY